MSTDFQTARIALGARLRELRTETGLSGKEFANRLGWQASKVSRLENGRQTATVEDLETWARAAGSPEATPDLTTRLRSLERGHSSWRRQLAAGHRAVQDLKVIEHQRTTTTRGYEATVVPGLFQTPDYARHVLLHSASLHGTKRDTDEAVRSRMRRQEVLYEPGKRFRVLLWEGALHVLVCPREVMAAQLDRLAGLIGRDTVTLGIVPLGAPMSVTAKHGFWVFDEKRVTVETISTELRFTSAEDVASYVRVWDRLDQSAVYGPPAHRLIARARASLTIA
ncbi:helix-turn-helix transcriptional regulator [Streptomyces sp. JJ38]|uniref:helix-turn-helix domain-containing protein n=1 Tax=Streptomyces sp. JJ38 TaxID=2738128 RepID=UPI001C55B05D|nr:helix-turn-helix transcriptional regulator [Streptomyces sp. JJ38]MBW1598252.1 helix-turn-helix transcriptional regulator [Streptomyces sp. JJ38]